MSIEAYIRAMPKVELHVHLERATSPKTLFTMGQKNRIDGGFDMVEDVRTWYQFTAFPHFPKVYMALYNCICSLEDIELLTSEFLIG